MGPGKTCDAHQVNTVECDRDHCQNRVYRSLVVLCDGCDGFFCHTHRAGPGLCTQCFEKKESE